MSLKIDLPRPAQLPRSEQRTSPGFAPHEPAPGSPRPASDGFERRLPGSGGKATGGSRYEPGRVGAKQLPLSKEAEAYKSFVDDFAKSAAQSVPPPSKRDFSKLLKSGLELAGASKDQAKQLGHYGRGAYAAALKHSDPTGLSVDKGSCLYKVSVDESIDKNWGDILESVKKGPEQFNKLADALVGKLKLGDDATQHEAKDYFVFSVADRLAKAGLSLGKAEGSGTGALADLPQELEPHRSQLQDISARLARDPKLDSDAKLRKALWSELKKLDVGDTQRQGAREYLLEELAHLQDRSTAE